MEIVIPRTSDHAGLRLFDPKWSPSGELDHFTVEIDGPAIRATAPVYAYGAERLPDLFHRMAREWKGWAGTLEWGSVEGEFELACTADGLGHVTFEVSLSTSLPGGWQVHTTAQLDAGLLDDLADAARRFFQKNETAP